MSIPTPADATVAKAKITTTLINEHVDTTITAADSILFSDATDSNANKKDTVQGILDLATVSGLTNSSNATWMTVSADEEVNLPLQPAFLGRASNVTNVTGNGTTYTVIWATESYDIGGNFSTSTFTAPITGKYLICASVHITAMTGTPTAIGTNIVTSNNTYGNYFNNANGVLVSGTTRTVKNTVVADMDSGDTATVTIRVMGQDAGDDVDMTTGNGYDYLTVTLIA